MPGIPHSFRVRINDWAEQIVTVSTENHRDAAMAAPAILGIETAYPLHIEIRLSLVKGEDAPQHFLIEEARGGGLMVSPDHNR